ncbi:MAG: flagellar hook-length control protein FliK [Acidobacteriota bacterium]
MNTAPVSPLALERAAPPQPPALPAAQSFADLLAGNSAMLAGFALPPAPSMDGSAGFGAPVASKIKKTDDGTDATAAAAIPLPVPVQQQQSSNDPASGDVAPPKPAGTTGSPPQQQPSASQNSPANGSGTATQATAANAAQAVRTAAVPGIGAEIGARVAVAAQGLVSQPSQALAALPHGAAPPTASAPTAPSAAAPSSASAHGAAAPDPAGIAPKTPAAAAAGPAGTPAAAAMQQELQPQAVQNADALPGRAGDTVTSAPAPSADDGTEPGMPPAPGLAPAPVAVSAASGETPPPPAIAASALEQVAAGIKQAAKGGLDRIEIQLKPPALGAIDVRLELAHDGRVNAVISADRSDTLMMLQRGSGDLQQALRDAGLQTDAGSLSFNLRGDAQANNQGGSQTGNGGTSTAGGSAGDPGPAPAAPAAASALHAGLLDIQV